MTPPDGPALDPRRLDTDGPAQTASCLKPFVRALAVAWLVGAVAAGVGFFWRLRMERDPSGGYGAMGIVLGHTLAATIFSAVGGGVIGLGVRPADISRLWDATQRPVQKWRRAACQAVLVGGGSTLFLVSMVAEGAVVWFIIAECVW
jgi:hypothetical protein